MIPAKPVTMLDQFPHVLETLLALRGGAYFQLPRCEACHKQNYLRGARAFEWDGKDAYPYMLERVCECVMPVGPVPVTEDAVVGMVRRLVVPHQNPSPPAAASPAPAEDLTRPNTAHLFFAVDTVCCAVCGGEEPFSVPVRTPFPTVLRALRVIADRHPASPHALSASL